MNDFCRATQPQHAWTDARIAHLHQASTGNPFVLLELLGSPDDAALTATPPTQLQLPQRLRELLQRRLVSLNAPARGLVQASAIVARPLPLHVLAHIAGLTEAQALAALPPALQADLLTENIAGLNCRHDLVRQAIAQGISPSQAQALHRRAAQALSKRPEGEAEPLAVAQHWREAQEAQAALAWLLRGAEQLQRRGRFDDARKLWQQVAQQSLDAPQALQARLALANGELHTDLARGRTALQEVLEQLPSVTDPVQRAQIEAQALAAWVDNAVFCGDMASAQHAAARLRPLMRQLSVPDRIHACEVLMELAMREPDIPAAQALLAQCRRLRPVDAASLSFEAQIHWFGGDVRAAHTVFVNLLQTYPDYCGGLTIENDLAVMLHALGDLPQAEQMARRSLLSWAGVAHTETLSFLVLGSVLTSAGQYADALAALAQALHLGRAQASPLFESEALVRRARLYLQCGRLSQAQADLDRADPLLHGNSSPLPLSHYALIRVLSQTAQGLMPQAALLQRLRDIAQRSQHPLLHSRLARIEFAVCMHAGNAVHAALASQRQADIARAAGLKEPLAEALWLQASAHQAEAEKPGHGASTARALLLEAAALADAHGFVDLTWRAHTALATLAPARGAISEHSTAAKQAMNRLLGQDEPALFLPAKAALCAPFPVTGTVQPQAS